MICQIGNSVFTKILWGLMGLYLLNISVDTSNPNSEHLTQDLTISEQESIIEIIVEQVLGYEDAITIKGYDDNETEDNNKKTNIKIDLISNCTADYIIKKSSVETKTSKFPDFNAYLTNSFQQLDTPPPQN